MAVPLGLGALPQETPVNGQKKICSLQDACPRFIWKLQAMSFCELVSYRMVCLEVSPNCMPPTFPGNFRIFFSQSPKLRQRKGLIIPFLLGPLSGVFPFPHTTSSDGIQKNMEGNAWILAMVKISYRFLALTKIDPKHCYKMTGPTSFCSKCCLLQNDTPSRKHTSYKMVWFRGKILLQNDSVCWKNESPTWTWVHPFYNRNWHRDTFNK